MGLLLGIDLGTTAVKSAVFNETGNLIAHSQSEYITRYPGKSLAEQLPEDWWQSTVISIKNLFKEKEINKNEIKGIGISSQAPTMLPLDKNGNTLFPALIWMDRRSDEQCNYIKKQLGTDTVFNITGNNVDPYYILPELLWFKENKPKIYKNTHKILQTNGYINYKLTGKMTIDKSHLGLTLLYNIFKDNWSELIFNKMGLSPDLFPKVYKCSEIIGEVTKKAAKETGLKAGTPVIAGMVDGPAAALEAGAIKDGSVCEMTGTSTVLLVGTNEIVTDINLTFFEHALKNMYLLIGAMSSTGASLKWFRDQLGCIEKSAAKILNSDPYSIMNLELKEISLEPTGIIYLPYLNGERAPIWDSKARGVFFGLDPNTSRAHLIKSIMEGSAYGLKHNLEIIKTAGIEIKEIRSIGGGTKSKIWNQIKADVTNTKILVPETAIGAPFGDAILAAYGIGIFSNLKESLNNMVKIKEKYYPSKNTVIYNELFKLYKNIYLHLKNDFKYLDDIKLNYKRDNI